MVRTGRARGVAGAAPRRGGERRRRRRRAAARPRLRRGRARRRRHERRHEQRRAVRRSAGHRRARHVRPRASSTRCSISPSRGIRELDAAQQRGALGALTSTAPRRCSRRAARASCASCAPLFAARGLRRSWTSLRRGIAEIAGRGRARGVRHVRGERAGEGALLSRAAAALPTVADDSGLEVDALGGAPGVRSKRWSGRADLSGQALDDANNAHAAASVAARRRRPPRAVRVRGGVRRRRRASSWRAARCAGAIVAAPRGERRVRLRSVLPRRRARADVRRESTSRRRSA